MGIQTGDLNGFLMPKRGNPGWSSGLARDEGSIRFALVHCGGGDPQLIAFLCRWAHSPSAISAGVG